MRQRGVVDAFQRAQACGNLAPLPQLERSQQQGPEGDGGRGRHPHMFNNNARTSTAPTNTTARPPPPRGAGQLGLSASARVYSNIFDPSPLSPLTSTRGLHFLGDRVISDLLSFTLLHRLVKIRQLKMKTELRLTPI